MKNRLPVRASVDGTIMHRWAKSFLHADLCAAFSLDPATYSFDLPRSAYDNSRDKTNVSGYVLRAGQPCGVIHLAHESDRFRDLDPTSAKDNLDLKQCHNH